jgi:hypothetical protein
MEFQCRITIKEPKLLLETLNASEDIILLDQDYTEEDDCHLVSVIFNKEEAKLNLANHIFINRDFVLNYVYSKLYFEGFIIINAPLLTRLKEFLNNFHMPDCSIEFLHIYRL